MSCEFKSPDLPQYMYRDPSLAYERTEAQSCHGCKYAECMRIAGIKVETCKKGRKHGRKCKFFVMKLAVEFIRATPA